MKDNHEAMDDMAQFGVENREALAQQAVPEIDYDKLIKDCYRITKQAQGTRGCVWFKLGAEWFREQVLAAAPAAPQAGNWIAADDVQRLTRELDVLLNGEEGAAPQASLCDLVAQVRAAKQAAPQAEQRAASDDIDNLLSRFERHAHRLGELWERCQGKGWPTKESDEFTTLRDDKLPELKKRIRAALAAQQAERGPIDMVLHCPKCGKQHIDAPEAALETQPDGSVHYEEHWTNPPHRSHLCHGCGHVWRPADVATNGVQAVKTKGKADSPVMQQAEREPLSQAPAVVHGQQADKEREELWKLLMAMAIIREMTKTQQQDADATVEAVRTALSHVPVQASGEAEAAPQAEQQAVPPIDSEMLDFITEHRVAVSPEFEGCWDASRYDEEADPVAVFSGSTPREAISAAMAADRAALAAHGIGHHVPGQGSKS